MTNNYPMMENPESFSFDTFAEIDKKISKHGSCEVLLTYWHEANLWVIGYAIGDDRFAIPGMIAEPEEFIAIFATHHSGIEGGVEKEIKDIKGKPYSKKPKRILIECTGGFVA